MWHNDVLWLDVPVKDLVVVHVLQSLADLAQFGGGLL